jgi:3-oxoacyl-[acyl-carrier-protein] synthase II
MAQMPVITGLGLVTPLGRGVDLTWQALLAGRCILDHAPAPGIESAKAIRLASLAATEALRQSGWDAQVRGDVRTALVMGTSKGPVEEWMRGPWPHLMGGVGQTVGLLAHELAMNDGPRTTVAAACASGLQALALAAQMIAHGQAGRALVVAVEASVHPLFISSFARLGVIAPPGHGCRPFDRHRRGFLMSEAAAAVCLESPQNPVGRPLAQIDRLALGGDAARLTASDPAGRTLRRLLAQVIDGRPIDLIHAHGTGTVLNDPIELSALESSVPTPTILYSHKGALGHSLGASGLISIVLNCLSHQHSLVPPNVQTHEPLPTESIRISSRSTIARISRSAAIATGFGGPAAAVSLISA